MKICLFVPLMTLLFASCNNKINENKEDIVTKDIQEIILSYDKFYHAVQYATNPMGKTSEDLLNLHEKYLIKHTIQSEDTLSTISEILSQTPSYYNLCEFPFDTDIVAIVKYKDSSIDTIGFPLSTSRGFVIDDHIYDNPLLNNYIIQAVADRNADYKAYVENAKWGNDYKYHGAPYYDENANHSIIPNYGVFHNSPVAKLAFFMSIEQFDSIEKIIKEKPELMYARDDCDHHPLISHPIIFHQDSIVHLFLKNGFDPNHQDDFLISDNHDFLGPTIAYVSPLMLCCENYYANKCGYLLIEYGADVNANYAFCGIAPSPLLAAIYGKNYAMVQYLIDHGATIETLGDPTNKYGDKENVYIKNGLTILDMVLQRKDYYQMALLLIKNGANTETSYIKENGGLVPMLSKRSDDYICPSNYKAKHEIIENNFR